MFKEYSIEKLTKHKDERGVLFEAIYPPNGGCVYVFTIEPGHRRGDHYHKEKHEWFTCVVGRVTILLETKEGKKEKIMLDAQNPKVVYNVAGITHAFLNEMSDTAMVVCYGSRRHDPDDPDTFKKFIDY